MLSRLFPFALLIFLFFPTASLYSNVIDRVVAVVNDDVITLSEINEEGKVLFQEITQQAAVDERENKLQEARLAITEKIIERKLMLQEADRLKITVGAEETEAALQRILTENHADIQQLRDQLAKTGMSEEKYRSTLRDQVIISKLVNREVRSKIVITDEKILQHHAKQFQPDEKAERFYLLQIGCLFENDALPVPSSSTRENTLKRIERVRILALSDPDFKKIARQYSDMPSAKDGGDLGFFTLDEMAPGMREAVSKIKPGELTDIIETENGYQFFKLLPGKDSEPADKTLPDAVRTEIQNTLFQQELKSRYQQWIQNLRAQAYVKIL